jgi:hypothetical protein
MQTALQRRSSVDPIVTAETWRDEIAYRTGIPVDFIEALHLEVLRFASVKASTMEEYIRWFFGWLGSEPSRMEAVFAHRLPTSLRVDLSQGDLLGGKLSDAVWGWMSGETLVTLNTRLGGVPAAPGKCDKARKFVLKMIPDLAFAAGLVTRIRRKQIDEAGGKLPLTLATLALCIREGVPEPEIAAIKISRLSPASRAQVTKEWREVEAFARPRDLSELFGKTRERVLKAQSLAKGS